VTRTHEIGPGGKFGVALSLTAIGGFVDAVGYIVLFQVFTANMSGNSVHIGIFLGQHDWPDLLRPFCAVAAYVLGMLLTRVAIEIAGRAGPKRIASATLAAEAVLLLLLARATPALYLGHMVDLHSPAYFTLVALLAFAMGVQTATLTHIGALTIYTTFVTGTLTKFAESLTRALFWTYDEVLQHGMSHIVRVWRQQKDVRETAMLLAIWSCYVLGAAAGAVMEHGWELRALYLPVVVLIGFIVVDQLRPIDVEEEKHQTG